MIRVEGVVFIKRLILIFTLSVLLIGVMSGCSSSGNMQEPPELSISVGDKQLDYVAAKNKWNGSIVEISFKSNPPDKFTVSDILIDENGRQIYTDKEIKNIPVELNNSKCSFEITPHFASALSSYYEPNKKEIRGFRMIASWGENECEYAFIIKTFTNNKK